MRAEIVTIDGFRAGFRASRQVAIARTSSRLPLDEAMSEKEPTLAETPLPRLAETRLAEAGVPEARPIQPPPGPSGAASRRIKAPFGPRAALVVALVIARAAGCYAGMAAALL